MQFEGAVVKEQGVTFGIIVVKPHVLRSTDESSSIRGFATRALGRMPVILMAQEGGRTRYSGRRDIVTFLSKLNLAQIPWKKYTLS